jgi:hypothetical protein
MHLLADENFNNQILRGLARRVPNATIIRIQDTEITGKPDTTVLAWAVQHNYILLTYDVNTLRGYFYDRVNVGLPVPGVFLIHASKPIGEIIDALELILVASEESEWQGAIHYLPF